jgi:hypothetical protein
MLGVEVLHRDGEVAVAVAELVGLGPTVVDGELELEGPSGARR